MVFSKKVLTAAAVLSGIFSVSKVVNLFFMNDFVSKNASAIGIIGGADGPTAVFIGGSSVSGSIFLPGGNWFFDTVFRSVITIVEFMVNTPRVMVVAFNFVELVFLVCIFLYCVKGLLDKRVKRM